MNTIRIEKIVIDHCRVPARMHFSYGSKESQDSGTVQIIGGGHVGYGECMGAPGDHVTRLASVIPGRGAHLLDGRRGCGRRIRGTRLLQAGADCAILANRLLHRSPTPHASECHE